MAVRESTSTSVKEVVSEAWRWPEHKVGRVCGRKGADAANVEAYGDSCRGSQSHHGKGSRAAGRGTT